MTDIRNFFGGRPVPPPFPPIETHDAECPVCFEGISALPGDSIKLSCAHVICFTCAQTMENTPACLGRTDFDTFSLKCPMCRNIDKPTYEEMLDAFKKIKEKKNTENNVFTKYIKQLEDNTATDKRHISYLIYSNNKQKSEISRLKLKINTLTLNTGSIAAAPIVEQALQQEHPQERPQEHPQERPQEHPQERPQEHPQEQQNIIPLGRVIEFVDLQVCQGALHQAGNRRTRKKCLFCASAACPDCKNECHTCLQTRTALGLSRTRYRNHLRRERREARLL